MSHFGMQKVFRNPGDLRGIPGVTKRRPVPLRDSPLPGTKTMLCPPDEHLHELVSGRKIEVILPSRPAKILGVLAMGGSIILIGLIWLSMLADIGDVWWGISTFAFVHITSIFSQILSQGRNQTGSLALLVLYGGMLASVIIAHFLP